MKIKPQSHLHLAALAASDQMSSILAKGHLEIADAQDDLSALSNTMGLCVELVSKTTPDMVFFSKLEFKRWCVDNCDQTWEQLDDHFFGWVLGDGDSE